MRTKHTFRLPPQLARQLAEYVNAALVGQAYQWVAARPDHPSFRDWTFPPPGPLTGVCNGGSIKLRPGLSGSENSGVGGWEAPLPRSSSGAGWRCVCQPQHCGTSSWKKVRGHDGG